MDPKVIIGIVVAVVLVSVVVWWCCWEPAEKMTLWQIPREAPVIVPPPNSAIYGKAINS